MPRYSVVIPTRERADTLRHSIATALAMEGEDYEVVVQDNASSPATREVVESYQHPRLVYSRSEKSLSMSENWELALNICRGEWIHFIGDDDGMMPYATTVMNGVTRNLPDAEVISWDPHSYWWPDCIVPHFRNKLYVRLSNYDSASWQNARITEKAYFDQSLGWNQLPMVYNSFVHRRVIDRVIQKVGSYFPSLAPDIFSGMSNLWAVDRFLRMNRPINVRGTSRHSIGVATLYRKLGAAVANQFVAENKDGRPIHQDLIVSNNTSILLANEQYIANALLHGDRPEYRLSIPKLVASMFRSINQDPSSYDQTLLDAAQLIAKHKLDVEQFKIPEKQVGKIVTRPGPLLNPEGQVDGVCVDGDKVGLKTIADAVRLISAMVY